MIDTHSHLYDGAFDADRENCMEADRKAGVEAVLLPAVDSSSNEALWGLCCSHPDYCYPMAGLHPISVNEATDFSVELHEVERLLEHTPVDKFYAVGEIGLDLHWRQDRLREQQEAFAMQIELALKYDLPVAIHTRDAMGEMHDMLACYAGRGLRGVMHAFSGTHEDYVRIKGYGDFVFGIGGVVTYKNSALAPVVAAMSLDDIVLESDAPYLPPVPMRGRRNQSSMMAYTCATIAGLHHINPSQVDLRTTYNAKRIFGI